jgi:putative hydrolase of the HAD superfamily
MKAVMFDLWNTLLYCPTRETVEAIIRKLRLGGKADYAEVISRMDGTVFVDPGYGLERVFSELCMERSGDCSQKKVDAAVKIWKGRLAKSRLFPEAKEALDSLSDYRLALVSNTDASGAEHVRSKRIDRYFDVVVMSCYVGVAKPDPGIYKLAAKELGIRPKDCWMVGDSLQCDADGARAARMNSILLDRRGHHCGSDHRTVRSLKGIKAVVDGAK